MQCTYNINGLKVVVDGDNNDYLINSKLIDKLNKEQLQQIIDSVIEDASETIQKTISIDTLKKEGIVTNTTASELADMGIFDLEIPEEFKDTKILYAKNIQFNGETLKDIVINSNGEEIFIIRDHTDATKVAAYLQVMWAIYKQNNSTFENIEYSSDNKILKAILKWYQDNPRKETVYSTKDGQVKKEQKVVKVDDIKGILIEYLSHKTFFSKSSNIIDIDGKQISIGAFLRKYIANLRGDLTNPIEYDLDFLNILLSESTINNNSRVINIKDLNSIIYKVFGINLNKIDSISKLKEVIDKSENEDIVNLRNDFKFEQFDNIEDITEAFLLFTFSGDSRFNYKFSSKTDRTIILKRNNQTILERFNIAMDTIQILPVDQYRGFNIYDYSGIFFITETDLKESYTGTYYNSKTDAKVVIDKIINSKIIRDDFRLSFQSINDSSHIKSKKSIPTSTKVSILKSDIQFNLNKANSNRFFSESYQRALESIIEQSLELKDTIIEILDTPEKVGLFLGSELGTTKEKLEAIKNGKPKTYYVENKIDKDTYAYFPMKDDYITDVKQNPVIPTVQYFTAISKLFNKLGVKVNLVSRKELDELGINGVDSLNSKAFIYNGEIYINTTIASTSDLFHEYIHLVLGVIKTTKNGMSKYMQLMDALLKTDKGKDQFNKMKKIYKGRSQVDIVEETFAKMLSDYLRKEAVIDTDGNLNFGEITSEINTAIATIFDDAKDQFELSTVFKRSINGLFSNFTKHMKFFLASIAQKQLKESLDKSVQYRKIQNLIQKGIEGGNIKEEC